MVLMLINNSAATFNLYRILTIPEHPLIIVEVTIAIVIFTLMTPQGSKVLEKVWEREAESGVNLWTSIITAVNVFNTINISSFPASLLFIPLPLLIGFIIGCIAAQLIFLRKLLIITKVP